MSTLRTFLARRFWGQAPSIQRPSQRRWARVHDVRFFANHGVQDRIIDRYKDKLDRRAKEEGKKSIIELQEAYKEKITKLRKQAIVPGATGPLEADEPPSQQPARTSTPNFAQQPPPPPPTPQSSPSPPPPGVKTLSSFLDLSKLPTLPAADLENLWRLRHASNPLSLSFLIPSSTYAHLSLNMAKHPQFILPLPREGSEGAEIHFLQFTHPAPHTVHILFTHLAEYKLRGEYASPHTTVTLHTELLGERGVVLGQGEVMKGRGVSVEEARWLVMCLQKFYALEGGSVERRRRLLEMFTRGDEGFDVQALLDEAERL